MRESFSATKRRTESSSSLVAAASGGGGTRKSLPDEMAHVFQLPALGSTWLLVCPNAGRIDISITLLVKKRNIQSSPSDLLANLPRRNQKRLKAGSPFL